MHPFKFKALLLGRHYVALSDNVTSFHKTMLFLCQAVVPMIRINTALAPRNETHLWYTVMKLQVLKPRVLFISITMYKYNSR